MASDEEASGAQPPLLSPGAHDDAGAARPEPELLESRPSLSLAGERWSALSPRGRRLLTGAAVGALGTVLMVISVSHVTDLLTERRLRDEVALTAAIDIYASSTSPTGGRVDFYVVLHNDGSRRVQIARLAAEAGGLRLRSAGVLPQVLDGGSAVRVPLSVRLDCTRERLDVLRAAVSASPGSGRRRAVTVTLGASQLITDIADSLCSVKPELADQELSGPLRAAQAGDHPR